MRRRMMEIEINISELKNEGGDVIDELADFLKEKTKAKVDAQTDKLVVKGEEKTASRTYVRVLMKKFLHRKELKDYFRVISNKEKALMFKEKKTAEE